MHELEPENSFHKGQHHRRIDRALPAIRNIGLDPQGVVNADSKIRLDEIDAEDVALPRDKGKSTHKATLADARDGNDMRLSYSPFESRSC